MFSSMKRAGFGRPALFVSVQQPNFSKLGVTVPAIASIFIEKQMANNDNLPILTSLSNEWNASLAADYLWTNTNFGEAVTEVMTPLAWNVLKFTLQDWVFLPGLSTVDNIGGRPYINISIFASLFHVLRRSRQDLLRELESTIYMQLPEEMEIPLIPLSPKAILLSLINLARLRARLQSGKRHLPTYLATNPAWFNRMRTHIRSETSPAALAGLWHAEIKSHVRQGAFTVLGTIDLSANYTLRLRRQLASLVGPEDASLLIANLSNRSELLPSLGPVEGLAALARGEMTRDAYLEQYGHRGPHEFEISIPRPVEDPAWLEEQLAQFGQSPLDIQTLVARTQDAFASAWQRFTSRYPHRARGMQQRLAENARRARLREEVRSAYVRDRWLVRIFACRAGELTGLGDDIFFLTLDETLDLLTGRSQPHGQILSRQEIYRRFKALPPYPPLICGRFDPFQWAADPHRRSDIFDEHASHRIRASGAIRGAAGSAGRVEGLVRRLDRPEQGNLLQPGEILVTALTDISWTTIFPRAAAVVTDVGAPLSHAAIVARELGIPAVVGCGNATARLKTGDRVRVDGSLGVVDIL
jgi:pyruvate,water dikinase